MTPRGPYSQVREVKFQTQPHLSSYLLSLRLARPLRLLPAQEQSKSGGQLAHGCPPLWALQQLPHLLGAKAQSLTLASPP